MPWRRLQDVLKRSWRCLEDVLMTSWTLFYDVLETSWRRLKDVWPNRIYWFRSRRLKDVLKTSSEDVWVRRIYSSWWRRIEEVFWKRRRKTSSGNLQDVFIEANACWVYLIPHASDFSSSCPNLHFILWIPSEKIINKIW